ncbi:hypothetical protein AJ80_04423 [Polytolypa hystricis UAMH7299]|uniref:Uncharacterized protein n=1 Tax=Polytolypa hystricis (strain UAMH7299) TaxID=1447883 RepID=A0A2B7YBM9_POLH7|nr:hypothetical protein AJ80_04423 [Polytolypa hystricis UAMH7299]
MMEDFYSTAGCRVSRKSLTSSGLRWNAGSSVLFGPCKTPAADSCKCDRLQQVVPKSTFGSIREPGPLPENGALIFGQSKSGLWNNILGTTVRSTATNGIYSQPNTPLDMSNPGTPQSREETMYTVSDTERRCSSEPQANDDTPPPSPVSSPTGGSTKSDPSPTELPNHTKRRQSQGDKVRYVPEDDNVVKDATAKAKAYPYGLKRQCL